MSYGDKPTMSSYCNVTPAPQRAENIRSSGAGEVLEMARMVASQANAVVNDVGSRLDVVMHPAATGDKVPGPCPPDSPMAPLFNDLRNELTAIKNSLHDISRMIGRLDL